MNSEQAIQVYIGAEPAQLLAVEVLKFSIERHTRSPVEFYIIGDYHRDYQLPRDDSCKPRTPFSFQRFLIPEMAGYRGRAIYLDSDMQVFKDIKGLWSVEMHDNSVLGVSDINRFPQFSVLLIDCVRARWNIDEIVERLDSGELSYEQLMFQCQAGGKVAKDIPWHWNVLELMGNDVSLIHYSQMNHQPWISIENSLAPVWVAELIRAVDAGVVSLDTIGDEVDKANVRPGLLYQVENRMPDQSFMPQDVFERDKQFVAPHMKSHARWWEFRDGFKAEMVV